jgi:hypothetical protein
MTEERFATQDLIVLRKLTRAIADHLRGRIREYLVTLTPLLRPTQVLGEYVQGTTRGAVKGSDKAFKDLQDSYESIASKKPFEISRELRAPIDILSSAPEITPVEYTHVATNGQDRKNITVTSPLKWTLTYAGFSPARLRDMLTDRKRSPEELPQFLLHYLVMQIVVSRQTGLTNLLSALHFPVGSGTFPEFAQLPVTTISTHVSTFLPPDEVIMESTEISGVNVFEEVIRLEDVQAIRNPMKEHLLDLVKTHAPRMATERAGL